MGKTELPLRLLLAALIYSVLIWTLPSLSPNCDHYQQNAQHERQQTQLVTSCLRGKCQTEESETEEAYYQACPNTVFELPVNFAIRTWNSTLDDPVALFTAILGIATVALWWVTQGILRDTKDTSKKQLRAYVFPSSATINHGRFMDPPITNKDAQLWVHIEWKNTGQTPAYKVISWSNFEIIEWNNEGLLIPPKLEPLHTNTLGTSITGNRGFWTRVLNPAELLELTEQKKLIYLYGKIEYEDVFGSSHYTNFRLYYNGTYPISAGPAGLSFSVNGNDSD